MNGRFRFAQWSVVLVAVAVALGIGIVAYQAGVTHGLALQIPEGAASPVVGPYGWYRPWGFGLFGPFFFILFWFVLFRTVVWGGRRHRWHSAYPDDVPGRFEEWHRRAHERMKDESSPRPTA